MQIVIDIDDNDKQKAEMLKLLANENNAVLSLSYVYAKQLVLYGVDVAEKWQTATEQAWALGRAYRKGQYDEWERRNNEDSN